MTKLQSSLVTEETWVDGATEKLSAMPTATSALELDVSTESIKHHTIVIIHTAQTRVDFIRTTILYLLAGAEIFCNGCAVAANMLLLS